MRYLFIGYSVMALNAMEILIKRNHDVILLDQEQQRLTALKKQLDCKLFLGNGCETSTLEALYDPLIETVFCLSEDDRYNILVSMNAQAQGFKTVITRLEDASLEPLCLELGLHNLFLPTRIMGQHIAEFAEGGGSLDLHNLIKYDARLFSFIAQKEDEGYSAFDIVVPNKSRIICVYRDNVYLWPDPGLRLQEGDEVIMITHVRHIDTLRKRWTKRLR